MFTDIEVDPFNPTVGRREPTGACADVNVVMNVSSAYIPHVLAASLVISTL